MRGEVCIGFASFLSFASLLLLIFLHVGQMNDSTVPKGIAMARINISNYGSALAEEFNDPINGLYTTNASSPLGDAAGLRTHYSFGLYSYCASIALTNTTTNETHTHTACSNATVARKYQPHKTLIADMSQNYTILTAGIFADTPGLKFTEDGNLGAFTEGAYYLILIGTLCAALAFFIGVARHTYTFFISTVFALLGSLLLLIAAAIWTAMLQHSQSVNKLELARPNQSSVPLGIHVDTSNGLFILWAAFACLFGSLVPYLISCCTYRG